MAQAISVFVIAWMLAIGTAWSKPLPFEEHLYKGRGIPFYRDSESASQQKFIEIMKGGRMAERMASLAQDNLRMRQDLRVGFESCGRPNAFFSPQRSAIVICSELLELMTRQAFSNKEFFSKMSRDQMSAWFDGVIWGIYFHELAHALISINRIAITGREEDVADQFVVWVAANFIDLSRQPIITPTIWFFREMANQKNISGASSETLRQFMSDEHSLDEQRIYNLACWIYGARPDRGAATAQFAGLPAERASRCPAEYARLDDGIRQRFKKYFKPLKR